MKNIASRIVLCLLVCFSFYLLFMGNTYARKISKKEPDDIKKTNRSSIEKFEKVYSSLYFFPKKSEYKSIGRSSDWQSGEEVLLIQSKKGEFFELDRWDGEATLGTGIRFEYIPSISTDYGAIIFGYDPDWTTDNDLIEIYDLKKRKKIGSAWSSEYPLFEDIDGDKKIEMVIFKNVFALAFPGFPNWPVIIRFQNGLMIDDLHKYPAFIEKQIELTRKEKMTLQDICQAMKSEGLNCSSEEQIKSLEMQEKYLLKQLGYSGDYYRN